ncbi:MAG: NADH-quinone oxidoreductase subunit C, partial [Desulfofustis sp.]|nr:NADH-quinone oxidoreductase subunit C [Desulfofustis sp.]
MTDSLTDKLKVLFPDIEPRTVLDCTVIDVDPGSVPQVMEQLKTYPDLGFSMLLDITAVDYLTYPQRPAARFCVVYTLRNWERNWLLQVRTPIPDPEWGVESVAHLWGAADWAEREVYDQYGINFRNHPDLRRILNHWQFEGHPLRKDYDIFKG